MQWAFGNCAMTLRATTFDERTNISTMNIADDGKSQTIIVRRNNLK